MKKNIDLLNFFHKFIDKGQGRNFVLVTNSSMPYFMDFKNGQIIGSIHFLEIIGYFPK